MILEHRTLAIHAPVCEVGDIVLCNGRGYTVTGRAWAGAEYRYTLKDKRRRYIGAPERHVKRVDRTKTS